MSDTVSKTVQEQSQPETEQLTPAQIDARHARHLLERTLSQLERGERAPALLSCKQALHLAPHCALAHSVSGLLAALGSDWMSAAQAYEKAVENFGEGSVERARLVMLRGAITNHTPPDVATLLPNIPGEIVRLRAAIHAAPLAAFLNDGVPQQPIVRATPLEPLPPARRKSTPIVNAIIAALVAGLLSFIVVRALRSGETTSMPAPNADAPVSNVVANDPNAAPVDAGAPNANAAPATSDATPATAPSASPTVSPAAAPVTVNPANTPPAIRSTPAAPVRPLPAPTLKPTLPQPAASTPRATPIPRATPAEPAIPMMPPPRVTLPSAGRPGPEYRRVLPPN